MKHLFLIALLAVAGCSSNHKHAVIAHTATILGIQLAENPSYEVKLGFVRSEFAIVPSNRSSKDGDPTTGGGASDTADMLMELRYGALLSRDATLYQRLAVGSVAVSQPGAAFMFAKSRDGTLDATAADAVAKSFRGAPVSDAASATGKAPLARRFQEAADKSAFEAAAKKQGYASFAEFLIEPSTKPEVLKAITDELKVP